MPAVYQWFLILASIEFFSSPRWIFAARGASDSIQPNNMKGNDLQGQDRSQLSTQDGISHSPPLFVSDWNKDWSPPSVSGEVVWRQSRCIKIPKNLTLCYGAGYSRMHLPNLLEHESIEKVNEQATSWVPLLNIRCHPDTRIFLCSLFAPICHTRPIWPCRNLCQSVQASCEPLMQRYGFPWPDMLRCDKFPSDTRDNLCIGNQNRQHSKDGKRCSVCDQPDTLEGIVDHFCRVDTVMRLNVSRLVLSATNVRIIGSKFKALKNQKMQSKNNMLKIPMIVDGGTICSCPPLWNRSNLLPLPSVNETEYLVMGSIINDRLQVSLLQSFNQTAPAMVRAMSAMRKNTTCTVGIKHLLQQSTKNKKKSKKKENKQKAKTKKKENKQKLKARKHQKTENATRATNATKMPQKKKQKTVDHRNMSTEK